MSEHPQAASRQPEGLTPNRVLDTADRRIAAVVYLAAAVLGAGLVLVTGIGLMWLTMVAPLVAIAVYHFVTGRRLAVRDNEAISIASTEAGFDVGHASATLGFVGITARPVWEVLAFESGPTPRHQALVTVDGLTGEITGSFSEPVKSP